MKLHVGGRAVGPERYKGENQGDGMSETASDAQLLVERRGAVLWLTINREPRRNAMSHDVLAGMAQAIEAAQAQRDLRAIVITGAGSKAFCAGADLQAAQAFTTDYSEP